MLTMMPPTSTVNVALMVTFAVSVEASFHGKDDAMGCCRFRGHRFKLFEPPRSVMGGRTRAASGGASGCRNTR